MNKKLSNDLLTRRKLVLRREAIATLTMPQLRQVAGGDEAGSGEWTPCRWGPAPLPENE
jgi:hypothetical protein